MKAIEEALELAQERLADVEADRLRNSLWYSRADTDNLWRFSEALEAAYTLIETERKKRPIDSSVEHPLHRAMATVQEMMISLHSRYPGDPAASRTY